MTGLFLNNNRVLFATSKKLETDKPFSRNRRKHNRELYLEIFEGEVDDKGDIKVISNFSKDVYNKFFEFDICFTPDYKKIYFTWNNFYMVQEKNASPVKQVLYLFKANIDSNFNLSNEDDLMQFIAFFLSNLFLLPIILSINVIKSLKI